MPERSRLKKLGGPLQNCKGPWTTSGAAVVLLIFAIVLAIVSTIAFAGARPGNIDDAFIVLVYARHLVDGGGFYWNQADGRVDGFTSIVDLLVKAGAQLLAPADPICPVFWTTLFFHVACPLTTLLVVYRQCRAEGLARAAGLAGLVGIAVAASPSLAKGSAFLLETPFFVCLGLALTVLVLTERTQTLPSLALLGILLGALALTRPEGAPVAVLYAGSFIHQRRRKLPLRRLFLPAAILAVIALSYESWHFWYFGHWAPNSYFAKTSASRWNEIQDGWAYVLAARHSIAGATLLLGATFGLGFGLASRWVDGRRRAGFVTVSAAATVSLVCVVLAGGDCYSGGRFLALPFTLATLALGLATAGLRGPLRLAPLGLLLLVAVGPLLGGLDGSAARLATMRSWPLRMEHFNCDREFVRVLTTALPEARVAESDFQRFKYFSDRTRVLDLHGLNDPVIAHEPRLSHVTFGKYRPENGVRADAEIWIWGYRMISPIPTARFSTRQLLFDATLEQLFVGYKKDDEVAHGAVAQAIYDRYLPASVPVCGHYYNVLARRDVVQPLAEAGVLIGSRDPR